MSEEQPQFKVTDRRLFNADGSPREIAEEEASQKDAAQGGAQTEAQSASASPASTSTADESEEAARTTVETSDESTARAGLADEALTEADEEVEGAEDPASFVNFLMSIASNAAASLGMMEHPVTGERGVDLQLGKHWIDVLGMLEQKTRGNLSQQERHILEGLLSDLRMQFVSLTNTAPSGKQRFTGRDIIGGK
jgi:hypothetical protein